MICANCQATVSRFDVHCRTCGARLQAPGIEQQLTELGIDVDQAVKESMEQDIAIDKEAHRARVRARNREIGRAVAGAGASAIGNFFKAVFRP